MLRRTFHVGHRMMSVMLVTSFVMSFFFVFSVQNTSAQIETLGPIDTNSQGSSSSGSKDDEINLSKSKYTPTGLAASARGENMIQLTWTDNAKQEDGYDIERRNGGGWRIVGRVDKNTTAYSDHTVVSGTTYTYRVAAFDSKNQTDWSNETSVKTPGLTPVAQAQIAQEEALEQQEEALKTEFDTILKVKVEEEVNKARQEVLAAGPATCTLAQVPAQDLDKAFRERCEQLTGQKITDADVTVAESFWHGVFNGTRARLLLAAAIFFILINNVIWHITHKTVKNRLKGEF